MSKPKREIFTQTGREGKSRATTQPSKADILVSPGKDPAVKGIFKGKATKKKGEKGRPPDWRITLDILLRKG